MAYADDMEQPEAPEAEEFGQEESSIPPEQFVQMVTQSLNIAADMDEEDLKKIAQDAIADYDLDKDSMSEWTKRMEKGLDLAKLVKEDKTHPFEGAANIKYPTVTSAALQFNARSYPAIVPSDRIVKAKVWGADPQGQKAAQGDRISEHMSWQLSGNVVKEWEASTDKLLTQLPIVGEMFRKWWLDPVTRRPMCRLVKPGCLIVNDKVESIDAAPRLTEELPLYPYEIKTRIKSGQFVEFDYSDDPEDRHAAQDFIEQHTRLDLDEDGYPEPYIVTVHKDTQTVVRIVADFQPEDVSYERQQMMVEQQMPIIDPLTGMASTVTQLMPQEVVTGILAIERGSHFVDFEFMPSMDGGFHGTGLGLLLGDISESINSIFNMLLDAGHYASLGGGWIGSEFRMKGGNHRHRPGEFKMVHNKGPDIKNAIVERTFPGPDAVLFQMLGMLIDASEKLSSTHAIMTGDDGGKNMQPTTIMALIEQGMKVFTAVYKRIFRSLKKEFRLLAKMNAQAVSPEEYNQFHDGEQPFDPAQDYGSIGMDIQPVADPNSVIKSAEIAKAQILMGWAEQGLVNGQEALMRATEAMDIEDAEALAPQPDPMQQQMAMLQMQAAQADVADKAANVRLTLAKVESELASVQESRASVVEKLSSAQTDQARLQLEAKQQRLDGLMKVLEEDRARLEAVLKVPGRMEGQSGDGGSSRGGFQGIGAAQGTAMRGLLEGGAGVGSPAAGNPVPGGSF